MYGLLRVEYFSDVLCIWAWIAARKNRELLRECPDRIELNCQFLDLFSDTETRVGSGGGTAFFMPTWRNSSGDRTTKPVGAES
jgi:hypothetical protein